MPDRRDSGRLRAGLASGIGNNLTRAACKPAGIMNMEFDSAGEDCFGRPNERRAGRGGARFEPKCNWPTRAAAHAKGKRAARQLSLRDAAGPSGAASLETFEAGSQQAWCLFRTRRPQAWSSSSPPPSPPSPPVLQLKPPSAGLGGRRVTSGAASECDARRAFPSGLCSWRAGANPHGLSSGLGGLEPELKPELRRSDPRLMKIRAVPRECLRSFGRDCA